MVASIIQDAFKQPFLWGHLPFVAYNIVDWYDLSSFHFIMCQARDRVRSTTDDVVYMGTTDDVVCTWVPLQNYHNFKFKRGLFVELDYLLLLYGFKNLVLE